jgi:Na+/phosphate symporter
MMTGDRLMQQVIAVFSVFMVFFYLGAGWYFIFYFDMSILNKSVRVLFGSAFIFYGLYRAYRAYIKIVQVFFTKEDDDE